MPMRWEEVKRAAREVRVVALDMDGTCLGAQHEMTSRTRRAIQALVDRGLTVVPASGRGFYGLREEVIGVPEIRYVISNNGAILTDGQSGKRLLERDIPTATVLEMIRALLDTPYNYLYCDDGEPDTVPGPVACLDPAAYRKLYDHVPWGRPLCTAGEMAVWVEQAARQGVRCFKVGFFFGPERTYDYYDDFFARRFPQISAFHSSGVRQYECALRGVSKGEALGWLCARENIAPGQVLAMGDNGNDAAMLQMAGVGVAMANSPPEIRAMADFVAGPNDREGAAQFLEQVFLL